MMIHIKSSTCEEEEFTTSLATASWLENLNLEKPRLLSTIIKALN